MGYTECISESLKGSDHVRVTCRQEDNIKTDLKEIVSKDAHSDDMFS